jgi:hypothetical protein
MNHGSRGGDGGAAGVWREGVGAQINSEGSGSSSAMGSGQNPLVADDRASAERLA